MNHICTITNTKWDCRCGKCGYSKNGLCLYHRELTLTEKLDTSIIAMVLGSIEETCTGSLKEICTLAEDELLELKKHIRRSKPIFVERNN